MRHDRRPARPLPFVRPKGDDPGAPWADALLRDLARQSIAVDVAPAVMRRVRAGRPASAFASPAFTPLPERWQPYAWAASFFLGLAALGLLAATGGLMIVNGDPGARGSFTLLGAAAKLALLTAGYAGSLLTTLGAAALAIGRGAWTIVETMAPLVRGAGLLAATGGALSILVSFYVFDHARRTAPVAGHQTMHRTLNGGLS